MKKLLCALLTLSFPTFLCAQIADALKGILPPTDIQTSISLNGTWRLHVVKGIDNQTNNDLMSPDYEDASWQQIPVPGNWEIYGFNKPRYTYPDSLTGYYRTSFSIPASWMGRHLFLRMDGVLRGYEVWVNGVSAGKWESAFNTCLFDITSIAKENNTLVLKVYSRHKGYEFDCFDDWAPMGIFRDVSLFCVPDCHLNDMTITTRDIKGSDAVMDLSFLASSFKHKRQRGLTIKGEIIDPRGATLQEFSSQVTTGDTVKKEVVVNHAELWTAETPHLYTLRYSLCDKHGVLQQFSQHFGIRKLTIEGNVIRLNGKPVKFRGVNYHSTDPYNGKVATESLTLKDMKMMKEANINYIRTSHYPHEPRFYELCDSLGFYVVNEVPFGKGDEHLTDATYQDILLTRARATVVRDKNHACVMIWSIGNENPFTKICDVTGKYVKQLDPSRPICYPMIGSYFDKLNFNLPASVDIFAPHYPSVKRIAEDAAATKRPILFTEYCHTLGQSLEDHDKMWETIEKNDCLAGGSVWEWVDQGMPFKAHRTDFFQWTDSVWTSDEGGFMMCGNQGTDGLLYADRTPLPNYYELQRNYAQSQVTDTCYTLTAGMQNIPVKVRNRYDFINLKDHVYFHWVLTVDKDTISSGLFSPECAPRSSTVENIPVNIPADFAKKLCLLHFNMTNKEGMTINQQTIKTNTNFNLEERYLNAKVGKGNAMDLIQGSPLLRAGRKTTLSEDCKIKRQVIRKYLIEAKSFNKNKFTYEDGNVKYNGTIDFKKANNGTKVTFDLMKADTCKKILLETGIAFLLNKSIDRVQWVGKGPFSSYPGKMSSNNYGFYNMQEGDLYFEGNRMGVDAAMLTDAEGNGIMIVCKDAKINFEQTDRGIVLTYNTFVSGIGPKSSTSRYAVRAENVNRIKGEFYLYKVNAGDTIPLMINPRNIAKPFCPYQSQYDTYLMKFCDITE